MLRIAIILGSTRPGRNGEAVAKWVHEIAKKRTDAEFELVDIIDFNLPLLDEPMPPKNGPEGHPDLKGFGRDGRVFFWLRQGDADARAAHIGFVAKSEAEVNAFYEAAMAAGATDNGKPGARLYYDPRYYAANVFDPDGYSLEAVYKSWQHRQS